MTRFAQHDGKVQDGLLPAAFRRGECMGMPAMQTAWTVDLLDALPDDGQRYEIIDGELFVSPSPVLRHQDAVGLLYERLAAFLRAHRIGYPFVAPGAVQVGEKSRVELDVFVLPPVNGRKP